MKSPLRSFWSGLAAGALVTAGLLGTWFAASFDVTTGTWLEVEGDIRESSRESIRLKPQPASDSAQEAVSRAAPARASPVQRPLDKKSQRDAHFENLLDSLASRQRQEAFDTIFVDNVWGCASSSTVLQTALQWRLTKHTSSICMGNTLPFRHARAESELMLLQKCRIS